MQYMVIDTGNGHTGAFELGENVKDMFGIVKKKYPQSYALMDNLGMVVLSDDPSLYGAVDIWTDEQGCKFMTEVE